MKKNSTDYIDKISFSTLSKILIFGDSNVWGYIPDSGKRYNKNERWAGILSALLVEKYKITEAGCNNRTAFNDNPFGEEQTGYLALNQYLKEFYDIVILSIGINDLQKIYNPTIDEIRNGMEKFIKNAVDIAKKSEFLLLSPSVLNKNILKGDFSSLFDIVSIEKSFLLSNIFEELAKKYGCHFIDLNKITDVSTDGLHYSIEAHVKIADYVFNFLSNPKNS